MSLSGMDVGGLAIDSQKLDRLKLQAKQAPDQALKTVAKQFETVFLNMMLKSMREATPQDGVFDSEQTKMFTGMLDQQLAQSMADRGVGLADVMVRQLTRNQTAAASVPTPAGADIPAAYRGDARQEFVDRMRSHAEQASRSTGIPAHFIVGQAALESGWGKHEIRNADGSGSHNLFGIKADKEWKGKVAEVVTTEYHNGVASKQVERFRAYASYTEAFRDYAGFLKDDPRYANVLAQSEGKDFARALQQAGYATDPKYADKLANVIGMVGVKA